MTDVYLDSVEKLMNAKQSPFVFEVHQKVCHTGFNLNGRIARRMYVEDGVDPCVLYDIILPGKELQVMSEVGENWIKEGHLPVE